MTEPLDMSKDPDRFDGSAVGESTLPELLGEGSYEDERDNLTWLLGLVGAIAFLVLVSLIVRPR